jgi:hypothetical protein
MFNHPRNIMFVQGSNYLLHRNGFNGVPIVVGGNDRQYGIKTLAKQKEKRKKKN